ncbi:hybrid sensor histidine kinase/response regulator [Aestuariispira insulae]|uniref:hybrid sensor histidine kinase/response regulator n=1 Tax=Aestuariispira insulae TaxID=1461337 RepID=UPI0015F25D6A|nr:PAS domain S-box protein [Aestuariispira insulae]
MQGRHKLLERDIRRLKEALEAAPDAFVYYDEDDHLVFCNEKYRQAYPESAQAIREGASFEDILRFGLDNNQYAEARGREEEWLASRLTMHRNPPGPIEQKMPDGRWLRIEESRTAEGGVVGFRVDITELKKREVDLKASQHRFKTMIDASMDAILVIDHHGKLIEFNPAAEQIFGYKRRKVIGRDMAELIIPEEFREAHAKGMENYLNTGVGPVLGQRLELSAVRSDGKILPVELFVAEGVQDGQSVFVGYLRDITERVEATGKLEEALAQAQTANEAKSTFLANMSHEIRTPLNGMLGMAGMLMNSELTPKQKHLLKTVRASGDELLSIINGILDFSKLEANQISLEDNRFSIHELLEDVVELFWANAREKGLYLSQFADVTVPPILIGDAGRVRQVIANLVGNAVKFTNSGGVRLGAEVIEQSREHCLLAITVQDTGIGIAREEHENLFGRFSQVGDKGPRGQGVGLGLAISRQLCQLMQGELTVESDLGRGATFTATLKLQRVQEDPVSLVFPDEIIGISFILALPENLYADSVRQQLKPFGGRIETVVDLDALAQLSERNQTEDQPTILIIDDGLLVDTEVSAATLFSGLRRRLGDLKIVLIEGMKESLVDPDLIDHCLTRPVRYRTMLMRLLEMLGQNASALLPPHMRTEEEEDVCFEESYRILVAEDNLTNQELVKMMLEQMGHLVDICSDGAEVVTLCMAFDYDLILMDVQMPVMDGYEATRQIRALDPPKGQIPIIALTANVLREHQEKCAAAGMDGFTTKPISEASLGHAIKKVMDPGKVGEEADLPGQHQAPGNIQGLLDMQKINSIQARLAPDKFEMISSIFLQELGALREQFAQIPETSEQLGSLAHQLKGAAANFGAPAVSAAAARLELKAENEELEALDDLRNQLITLCEETETALRKLT